MDITNFMEWFIGQVVNMFTSIYNTLDNITFMGTSLLKVSLTIMILGALLTTLLTIANSNIANAEKSGKVKGESEEKNGSRYEPQHTYKNKHEKKESKWI